MGYYTTGPIHRTVHFAECPTVKKIHKMESGAAPVTFGYSIASAERLAELETSADTAYLRPCKACTKITTDY